LWKLPRYRSSGGRTIADAARELEIGTEQFRRSVRQDKDDRGKRDDRLISKDAGELKRLRMKNPELKRIRLDLAQRVITEGFVQEANALLRNWPTKQPARHQPSLAHALTNLAGVLRSVGRYDEALAA
jgi:transposase-like protein